MERKRRIKLIIVITVVILLMLAAGGTVFMIFGNYVNIKGQKLNKYNYSVSGGMSGGYYNKTVKRYDDSRAKVTIRQAEGYNQDPEVQEYLTDISIMNDLEEIIRNNKMNFWNGKKFTDMFIDDGESLSYHFEFDKSAINFSSQFYPEEYGDKLRDFDTVIERYINNSQK